MNLLFFFSSLFLYLFSFEGYCRSIDIDEVARSAMEKFNVPGAAVVLIQDGSITFQQTYGYRDLTQKLQVQEKTLFSIGSCTKSFTSLLIGQLVDEGLLDWDDRVIDYIPEFHLFHDELTKSATIRDLLAHRLGIPRHDAIWYCRKMHREEVIPLMHLFEPISIPRMGWNYHNFLYSIAGIIVERVLQMSWEEALQRRIFDPLDMVSAGACPETFIDSENRALPYAMVDKQCKELPYRFAYGIEPAGGIYCSIEDMTKWLKLQSGDLQNLSIDVDTLTQMHTLLVPFSGKERLSSVGIRLTGYSLGWCQGEYAGYPLICHSGAIDGFSAEMLLMPEKKIAMAILTNSSSDGNLVIASIRNTLLDRLLKLPKKEWLSTFVSVHQEEKCPISESWKCDPVQGKDDLTGEYRSPAYGNLSIVAVQGQLHARYGDRSRAIDIPLKQVDSDTFSGKIEELMVYRIDRPIDFVFKVPEGVFVNFDPEAKPIFFEKTP